MENLIVTENKPMLIESETAVAKAVRGGKYEVTLMSGRKAILDRNVDFGKISGTKSPSLYKAGAEKLCMAYGLMQRYTLESKTEFMGSETEAPFFHYVVRCDLVMLNPVDGKDYVFTSSYGEANSRESRNGSKKPFDAINSSLKMAQKRALVSAALSVSGLSSMFTQDIEDDKFMNNYTEAVNELKNDKPSETQLKALFALAHEKHGFSIPKTQKVIAEGLGYEKLKEVTQKQYEEAYEYINNLEVK